MLTEVLTISIFIRLSQKESWKILQLYNASDKRLGVKKMKQRLWLNIALQAYEIYAVA